MCSLIPKLCNVQIWVSSEGVWHGWKVHAQNCHRALYKEVIYSFGNECNAEEFFFRII